MSWQADFEPTIAAVLARIDAIQPKAYARTRNHLDGAVTRLSGQSLAQGFRFERIGLDNLDARRPEPPNGPRDLQAQGVVAAPVEPDSDQANRRR